MTTTRWLRISALIAFFFAVGHSLGGRKYWSPMGENAVLEAMRSTRFLVMGVERSYLDFYLAFGYSIAVFQFAQALLLWQLATVAASNPGAARPMIMVFAAASALCGIISYGFLFPVPAIFSALLFTTLSVSYVLAARGKALPSSRPVTG